MKAENLLQPVEWVRRLVERNGLGLLSELRELQLGERIVAVLSRRTSGGKGRKPRTKGSVGGTERTEGGGGYLTSNTVVWCWHLLRLRWGGEQQWSYKMSGLGASIPHLCIQCPFVVRCNAARANVVAV